MCVDGGIVRWDLAGGVARLWMRMGVGGACMRRAWGWVWVWISEQSLVARSGGT